MNELSPDLIGRMASENPSSDGRTRKQRKLTAKGQEFAKDILSREVKRRSRTLTNQISLFEDLLKTGDAKLVSDELAEVRSHTYRAGGSVGKVSQSS